jgi:hypothetical protein
METWYKVSRYSDRIVPIDVDGSTTKTVFINGWRRLQVSDFESYFRTRREARSHFVSQINGEINMLKRQMDDAMGRRETFLRNEGGQD